MVFRTVVSEVPLFCYINYILKSISLFRFTLVTDDTSLYYSCKNAFNFDTIEK